MVEYAQTIHTTPSILSKVPIGFEYDKTLREIRHHVKQRTITP